MHDIDHLLSHNVANIYPNEKALREVLDAGKKLRLYVGVDPTSTHLHIGHAMQFAKLREFQDLGHEVILLIGSFTAMIGDPTDKSATRKQLTAEEVLANAKTYKDQAAKILRFNGENAAKLMFNDEWLSKLTFKDVLELTSCFTVQQMMERDMFEKRWNEEKAIGLHEFLYPLMQGFDSVAMDVDLEIGGNDQTFNMLAGRTLMKAGVLGHKPKEKFVMAITLLTNDEGKKMSKSEGGMIALDDAPEDMFGKVMSMGDNMIASYFAQVLDAPESEISAVQRRMGAENPRDIKMELAERIVARYYDAATAAKARSYFVQVFQEHVAPEEMPEVAVTDGVTIVDALVATRLATSKTTARQLIAEGAVKLGDVIVADDKMTIDTSLLPVVLQKGKRGFVRLVK
jgi:tyrosyl-tRNA synthetase